MNKEVKAALCFVLWHHQGASSPIGQPIRNMLDIGQHDDMNAEQLAEARRVHFALAKPPAATAQTAPVQPVAWKPLKTSQQGRDEVAKFFVNVLKRHDFTDYIQSELAADFACVLSGYLSAAAQPAVPLTEKKYRLLEHAEKIESGDEVLDDDSLTWHPLAGWEVGMQWGGHFMMPMRRPIETVNGITKGQT